MSKPDKENNEEGEHEEIDIEELRRQALASMPGHNWKLRGTMLECGSCPFTHGMMIDPEQVNKILDQLD